MSLVWSAHAQEQAESADGLVQVGDQAYAGGWSLAQGVWRHSLLQPHALALASASGMLSYGQLARQSAGLARQLRGLPGWATGEGAPRVGILASRSAQACVAALGASWAGATYVPIGLKLPAQRAGQIVQRCGLTALVADAQGAQLLSDELLQALSCPVFVLQDTPLAGHLAQRVHWLAAHALADQPAHAPQAMPLDAAAYILFTSGSTGEPKGVVVPVRAVAHYVPTMADDLGLRASDRVLDVFELNFDVSVHNMLCTWYAGASLHQLPAAQVMNAVRFVREHRLTVWNSVPSLVALLGQVKAFSASAMPTLRLSSFGGEQLTRGVVDIWRQAAPRSAIINMYGPTEATVTCLVQRVEPPWPCQSGSDVLAVGQPLPGCEVAVIDAQGQSLPDGQAGELAIAGVQLATGYLDAPELTRERFVMRGGQRWYRTGDLALRDSQGRYHCLGRMDHQVKVLGHRIELEDIDAHLRQVTDAPLVATVAWPWSGGAAQGLVAFASGAALDGAHAVQALRARLPHYMVPARVVPLAQMPLNANGKVDRQALRCMLEAGIV